jgi:hypothetical protein
MAGFFDEEDVVSKPLEKKPAAMKSSTFFDPEDTVTAAPPKAVASSFFDTEDVVAKPVPDAIEKEIEERGVLDRPYVLSQEIKDKEVQQLAKKYGASPEAIRNAIPLMAGMPENLSMADVAKGVAGFAGEAVGLGVPQKLYAMAQDPKLEKALDELRDLISVRKSYVQMAGEFAVPGVGTAKLAKAVGGGIKGATTVGAVTGAAGGFGASRAGEETVSTALGAGLGAGIGTIAGKFTSKLEQKAGRKLTEAEKTAVSNLDYDKYEQQALKDMQESGSKLTEELAMGTKLPNKLNIGEMNAVLKENYGPRVLAEYLSNTPDNKLLPYIDKELADSIGFEFAAKKALMYQIRNKERSDLIKTILDKEIKDPQLVNAEWEKLLVQGKDFVSDRLQLSRKEIKILRAMENSGMYDHTPESKIGQLLGKLSDTKMHLRTIDEKWKTDTETVLDRLSQNRNIMGIIRENDKKIIEEIDDLAQKTGTRRAAKTGKIVDIIEGKVAPTTEGERQVADAVTKEFNRLYTFVTEGVKQFGIRGLDIPKLDQYAARMTKEVPEVLATIELELTKAAREASEKLNRTYRDIADIPATEFEKIKDLPTVRNLREYTNWINNADVDVRDGTRLSLAVRQSLRSEDSIRVLDKVARGSMERVAIDRPIPDFIREKDIYKVLDRYSQDMLSNLYQRKELAELNSIARILKTKGGNSEAQYIENIVEDTLGVRKGTVAHFMRDVKGQVARTLNPKIEKAMQEGNDTAAFIYTTMKEMVDLPSFLSNQIYPNLLGWRVVPVLTNALGGLARAAPELGGAYGYTNYMRGLVWSRQNWSAGLKELTDKGYVPGQWSRSGQKALADGIRASGLVNIPMEAMEKLNRVGMALYTKSEELNRVSLLGMSKMMAHDLATGSAGAQKSLARFPSSVQRAVARAKNQSEVEDVLMRHMNSTIAFNYNRPSLYEFGRTLGPMFATFAKWPTAIAGEIISEYRTKPMSAATRRVAERYAAPLLAFAAVDYMLADRLEEDERLQKIVGKSGITKAAPITSIGAFTRGDIFTPPAIDTIMQDIITPVTKAEGVAVAKGLDRAVFTYAPGAGFIKFITEDIPTIITGERPEGKTQTERTLQSLGVTR